jgi:hypothetical protein
MTKSRYDEIHDRFFSVSTSKEGTRYERLAAIVLKCLQDQHVVIHGFELRGASTVKHQIDVLIEVDGQQKRILIECKDFDKSKALVGLSIVRDFRSVVEDTQADEAFIVTCTGYTKPAMQYAKAKGIKLSVLRAFEEADWEGRIKQIIVNLHIQMPPRVERVDIGVATPEQQQALFQDAQAEGISLPIIVKESAIYFVSEAEKVQVIEFIEREGGKLPTPQSPTQHVVNVDPKIWKIQVGARAPHAFTLFKCTMRTFPITTNQMTIGPKSIAELILSGFGGSDMIIFADQLQRAKIDESGRVTYERPLPPHFPLKQLKSD